MDRPSLLQSGASLLRQNAVVDRVDRWLHRTSRVLQNMMSAEPMWPIPMRAIGAQNLLTMPGGVSTAGYLHKKGGSQFSLLKWPLRYIIIHKGCVYYFKTSTSAAPQGAFSLNGYNRVMRAAEETTSSNVFPFKIVHFSRKHRTWLFSAASEEERRSWMRHLRREIDHYNDRQECHTTSSDTDSDADSFYGTIERPLDLKHPIDNTDDGYTDEDDDEDDEDYLKPDSSPTNTGRPTGVPPSYPPPPVPLSALSNQLPPDPKPPTIPPPLHRIPTSPLPKKPPPPIPPHKGLPPAPPFAPHLQRHVVFPGMTPPLPPPNPRRAFSRPGPGENRERPPPVTLRTPTTLPICEKLESQLRLNRPAPSPAHSPAPSPAHSQARSPTHSHTRSPAPSLTIQACNPTHSSINSPTDIQALRPTHNPAHSQAHNPAPSPVHCSVQSPAHSSAHGPSLGNHLYKLKLKPPPPTSKPPLPASRKPPSTSSLGRASPDGQSFRAPTDELPVDIRSRWNHVKSNQPDEENEDDDDYENVQLPDSVFIDCIETSFVEKLFQESTVCLDGLYAIRNSGTKTSKVLVVWDVTINKARNYRLFEENGCIYLDTELTFPSLAILIEHYHNHPLPQHGSLCLKMPYSR